MGKRLLALVFVASALAMGPATTANAETDAKTPARTSVSVNDTAVRVTAATYGRYWS